MRRLIGLKVCINRVQQFTIRLCICLRPLQSSYLYIDSRNPTFRWWNISVATIIHQAERVQTNVSVLLNVPDDLQSLMHR